MARVTRLACDLCESENDCRIVTIKREPDADVRIDLCMKCYKQEFKQILRRGKPPARRVRRTSFNVVEPL